MSLIGVDLDNTLVCYDEAFYSAAGEEGLLGVGLSKSKEKIRDAIRLLPNGESSWTRLQAIVYGPKIDAAILFDGIRSFFQRCAESGRRAVIVSHKTHFAALDGEQVDLRKSALRWMEAKGFFDNDGLALSREDVFFEETRAGKIERIRDLRCTHFIDDLMEVFAEDAFPRETVKLLFAPHGAGSAVEGVLPFKSWGELERFLFG